METMPKWTPFPHGNDAEMDAVSRYENENKIMEKGENNGSY